MYANKLGPLHSELPYLLRMDNNCTSTQRHSYENSANVETCKTDTNQDIEKASLFDVCPKLGMVGIFC